LGSRWYCDAPIFFTTDALERFQDKWNRLSGSEARQNKDLEPCFDSIKTRKALGLSPTKQQIARIVTVPYPFSTW